MRRLGLAIFLSLLSATATDLSSASLFEANLRGTHLLAVNLGGANLRHADLSRVIFEPRTLPNIAGVASATNLWQMGFITDPQALVQLRKAFREAGYREQEREITYPIKHSEG